jgi:hypothetical protein
VLTCGGLPLVPSVRRYTDLPSPMSRCIPDDQASRRAPLTARRIPRGSRTRRSIRNASKRSGPWASQLLPSGLATEIDQFRPCRFVVSDHCSWPEPDATRIDRLSSADIAAMVKLLSCRLWCWPTYSHAAWCAMSHLMPALADHRGRGMMPANLEVDRHIPNNKRLRGKRLQSPSERTLLPRRVVLA